MRRVANLLLLSALLLPACAEDATSRSLAGEQDDEAAEDEVVRAADTKIKTAVEKQAAGLFFMSESDHPFVWVRSAKVQSGPASAAAVYAAFSKVTNGNAMADKPLAKLSSESVPFEQWAARFVPVAGEDADNFAYHQKMTQLLGTLRTNLKNPVVLRFGRKSGANLVGAISVYIVGTLPSGKVGGLFTVSVET